MTTGVGIAPSLKEHGGFWLPNEAIDLHARHLGSRGVHLYAVLARSCTATRYPSVGELAGMLACSSRTIRMLLARLRECNLLNDFDLQSIRGYTHDNDVGIPSGQGEPEEGPGDESPAS